MIAKTLCLLVGIPALLVAACTSEDPVEETESKTVHVTVSSDTFEPASLKIKKGQIVRWTWQGGTHNVVSGPDCDQHDGFFRSGAPQGGGTFEKPFDKTGTFPYFCELHCGMGMKGEIVVE
jgi:plastocyanin